MALEAYDAQKLMDDTDDDLPLVFKRSSSSGKQSLSTSEAKKRLPQKPDRHAKKLMDDTDDDSPLVFERSSSSGKQSLSTSEAKKRIPRKPDRHAKKLMDDTDDDSPLVFKRSSSSGKQSLSTSEAKKRLPRKPDRHPEQYVYSHNSQGANAQKSKMSPSSKSPPGKFPLSSSDSCNSLAKGLAVKPSKVDSKPYSLAMDGSNSAKHLIKDGKPSTETKEDLEDSDDDKPLSARFQDSLSKVNSDHAESIPHPSSLSQQLKLPKPDDSDDEMPLSSRFHVKFVAGISICGSPNTGERKHLLSKYEQNGSASTERKPSANLKKRVGVEGKSANEPYLKKPKLSDTSTHTTKEISVKAETRDEDDEDNVPILHRMKKLTSTNKKASSVKKMTKPKATTLKKNTNKPKKLTNNSKFSKSFTVPPGSGGGKWTTLVHNGVIFPPPYNRHGVKMLYKGKPVDLNPEQEEVATMYAVELDTDIMNKPQFKENFMADWRKILGKNHVIRSLDHCDFTPIYEWHLKEKEKKKQMTSEEKKVLREEKQKREEKYAWAIVDGMKEKVGNFRVEPSGLFKGRGEHPKVGKLKKRIRPSDITINIGKDAPIPKCPIPGESWKEIRHDNTVTWLAYWNDPINQKESKYVFLAASSKLKGQSDREKYEKARRLKDYIHGIRATYTKNFTSKDLAKRQIAVATYLIDKLALRAGNEKDNDEANTVGCCTLKVEHVEPVPPNILKFDFLGKDSIRYDKEVEVLAPVFKAIQQFRNGKKDGDDLFDSLDTSKLNAHLKELMPGLTAKVFRTYNASITLDDMLSKETRGGDVAQKCALYDNANREVAIICNHQRSEPKNHDDQMLKLKEKIDKAMAALEELQMDLIRAKEGKPPTRSPDGKTKRKLNPDALETKIAQSMVKIEKMERDMQAKENKKNVSLGTSKVNYNDPRITVAWCKLHEVPIEKIFNESQRSKFVWAMDVDPDFRF